MSFAKGRPFYLDNDKAVHLMAFLCQYTDCIFVILTHKLPEKNGCILSTVVTDALVLKAPGHQYLKCCVYVYCIGMLRLHLQ